MLRIMGLRLAIITAIVVCVTFQVRSSTGLTCDRHDCLRMMLSPRTRRITVRLFGEEDPLSAGIGRNDDTNMKEIQSLVGLSDKELERIVSRIPQIKTIEVDVARNTVSKLQSFLSLTDFEFKKKIILRLPQCLGYEYESEIEPNLVLLQTGLIRFSEEELVALVLKCPQILGLDYTLDIKPKIEFVIQESMGGGDAIDVAKTKILDKPASLNLPVRGAASKAGL